MVEALSVAPVQASQLRESLNIALVAFRSYGNNPTKCPGVEEASADRLAGSHAVVDFGDAVVLHYGGAVRLTIPCGR